MRLRGIHEITPRWSQAARKRAIADLAEQARRQYLSQDEYREILDRISHISGTGAKYLEERRAYFVKGSRYAEDDERLIPKTEVRRHRELLHYPRK